MLILTEKPSVAKDFAKALGCSFSSAEKCSEKPLSGHFLSVYNLLILSILFLSSFTVLFMLFLLNFTLVNNK